MTCRIAGGDAVLETGAPFIDMTPGLDGVWEDDFYLDIGHFTQRGNQRAAEGMFEALMPILAGRGCTASSTEASVKFGSDRGFSKP